MKYGICTLSVVPMRGEASHESELVTELLYNDLYEVLEDNGDWLRIKCEYDAYEGWVRKLQHQEITDNEYDEYRKKKKYLINTSASNYKGKILSFGSVIYEDSPDSVIMRDVFESKLMVESAMKLLGVPYRWGGKSVMGIDCSAFVQLCAKIAGVVMPRDASQQIAHGKLINLNDAKASDLAFFENENKKITHVGILLSNDRIIHASGEVRIDYIDKKGIFNKKMNSYTHNLSVVKRLC